MSITPTIIGDCTLYLGDCLEVLPTLAAGSVDAVVTDPPYGIERFKKGFGTTRFKGHGAEKDGILWDKKPDQDLLQSLVEFARVSVIWGANNFQLPPSQAFFVWDKFQSVDNFASAELAYCNAVGVTAKVFRFPIWQHNQIEKVHPTQKPVELMSWCLVEARIPEGAVVLDPFMGSGTTGCACVKMGRKFIGIEKEERYFNIAVDRIRKAYADFGLFKVGAA